MRRIILAVLAIGALAAVSTSPAEAWGGCGIHRHPTPFGCRWNGGWGGPGYGYGYGAYYGGPGWRYRHWRRWHHVY